jgi:DNA polymerase-4
MVTSLIMERAPLVEKASIDEFYLDMTGMERFFGSYAFAQDLRNRIQKQIGLTVSFGLSVNKTVSKVATNHVKPAGEYQVPAGQEKAFLAPMTVNKIPMIGAVTAQTLRNMGIRENLWEVGYDALGKSKRHRFTSRGALFRTEITVEGDYLRAG